MRGRNLHLVLVFIVLASACNSSASAPTTSASPPVTTPVTSSTTSTVSVSTSTTTPPPTTTTTLIERELAEQPLIVANGMAALGWWDGTSWVQLDENEVFIPVSGDEEYQYVTMESVGWTRSSEPVPVCDWLYITQTVVLDVEDELSVPDAPGVVAGIGISAGWDVQPRPVTTIEDDATFQPLASAVLADFGYDESAPVIRQLVKTDIDGDGAPEVIVVAEETVLANSASDVYSVMFVVTDPYTSPSTQMIRWSVIPPEEDSFPASFRVGAVADLNGDGQMEVVESGVAWESIWITVHELTPDGVEQRLNGYCGV